MNYETLAARLQDGGVVILDGGTGTELERRGVCMDPQAWCGAASLENAPILEAVHRDYIAAGADIITASTYASSRLMLGPAGLSDQFAEINRTAVATAHRARSAAGREDVLIAGSLSHMSPVISGTAESDLSRQPTEAEMADAFRELANLLRDEGCDLIVLEMMYYPERIPLALAAATQTGLPVWAGFSARRSDQGQVLSFAPHDEIPFAEIVALLKDFDVAAAGVMHTPSDLIADAMSILGKDYVGPRMAYPDSGFFEMPHWQFENVITPERLKEFAVGWVDAGVQIIGGCCGLSPEHINALASLQRTPSG